MCFVHAKNTDSTCAGEKEKVWVNRFCFKVSNMGTQDGGDPCEFACHDYISVNFSTVFRLTILLICSLVKVNYVVWMTSFLH